MIYKNIKIHNAAELLLGDHGGAIWLRYPSSVCETFEREGAKIQARNSSGVELRFIMKSDTVKIKLHSVGKGRFHIFRGGLQGGWYDQEGKLALAGETVIQIERKEQETIDRVHKDFSLPWDSSLIRIVFDGGRFEILDVEGEIAPPAEGQTPKKTILFYGSSITHGSNSLSATNNWTSWVAHGLSMDFLNKGLAGSCCMEDETVSYLGALGREGKWDVAVLELGINVMSWEEEKRRTHVENTLEKIAAANPDKPIFVISPFYSNDDYNGGARAKPWRETIRSVIERCAYPNVTYIPGDSILGSMDLISADCVHPSAYGVAQIGERLLSVMRSALEK
jgi:lysophospholipase L1-like esterase